MALTHHELCQIAYKFLKRNGFKVCFHDRFIAVTSTGEQPDAMGFRNSASCLIEAKCSRADLLADRKKRFRKNPSLGMGDWRFFISEPGIISIEDLPPGWGLLHVVNGRVRKVHGWPRGNCCWGNPDDKPFTGNKQVECDYMLSALRRMELRGFQEGVTHFIFAIADQRFTQILYRLSGRRLCAGCTPHGLLTFTPADGESLACTWL